MTIIRTEQINNNLVALIQFDGVQAFDGCKILIYKDCDISKLNGYHDINPNFDDNVTRLSPIAKFEPSEDGWNLACSTAYTIN